MSCPKKYFTIVLILVVFVIEAKLNKLTVWKSDEKTMVKNQINTSLQFELFSHLLPPSHKMGTNLKLMSDNIYFCCNSLAFLALAAKQTDKFFIWQQIIYQKFNNIQIYFLVSITFFSQNGCQFKTQFVNCVSL